MGAKQGIGYPQRVVPMRIAAVLTLLIIAMLSASAGGAIAAHSETLLPLSDSLT